MRVRLKVYHEETAPLLEFYGTRGTLVEVDAVGPPDEVAVRMRRAVD